MSPIFVVSREPRLYKNACPSVRRSVILSWNHGKWATDSLTTCFLFTFSESILSKEESRGVFYAKEEEAEEQEKEEEKKETVEVVEETEETVTDIPIDLVEAKEVEEEGEVVEERMVEYEVEVMMEEKAEEVEKDEPAKDEAGE